MKCRHCHRWIDCWDARHATGHLDAVHREYEAMGYDELTAHRLTLKLQAELEGKGLAREGDDGELLLHVLRRLDAAGRRG